MQFNFATIATVAALVSSAASHMIMSDPPQWPVPDGNGPLDPSGNDYPCHGGQPNPTPARTYQAGSTAGLGLTGSAIHGGGSGQMLITYDFPPTKNSVWRVMHSWEGDHPFKPDRENQNFDPANPSLAHKPIPFGVPAGLPSGKAVFAWSWFNKIGNREMYMMCSTVMIQGKKSTASNPNQDPAMLALPTHFRANSGNGCEVKEGINAIAFKNPGKSVTRAGYQGVSIACDDSQPGTESSGADSGSSAPDNGEGSYASPPSAPAPGPSNAPTYGGGPAPEPSKAPAYGGAPSTGNGSGKGSDEEHGGSDEVELPNKGNNGEKPVVPAPAPANPSYPAPSPPANNGPSKSEPAAPEGGACPEGKVYCNPDNTWSMCGSGYIQKIGPITNGMKCVNGEFSAAAVKAKRFVRFSKEHRRHRRH